MANVLHSGTGLTHQHTRRKPRLAERSKRQEWITTSYPLSVHLTTGSRVPLLQCRSKAKEGEEFDLLRDGPLRYLGYANEVGEAFGTFIPRSAVWATYGIAIAYVVADTKDKWNRGFASIIKEVGPADGMSKSAQDFARLVAAERAVDTFVWQMFASVILPGITIHQIVHVASMAVVSISSTPAFSALASSLAAAVHISTAAATSAVMKSLPTAIGLAVIPFIIHPLDNGVHAVMDRTIRPILRKVVVSWRTKLLGNAGL